MEDRRGPRLLAQIADRAAHLPSPTTTATLSRTNVDAAFSLPFLIGAIDTAACLRVEEVQVSGIDHRVDRRAFARLRVRAEAGDERRPFISGHADRARIAWQVGD